MGKIDKDIAQKAEPTANAAALEANTIEQVRELLFGQEKRSTEQRHRDTQDQIEALHVDMLSRFAMLESRLADTERALDQQHNAAISEISTAITDLGTRVGKLVTHSRGK